MNESPHLYTTPDFQKLNVDTTKIISLTKIIFENRTHENATERHNEFMNALQKCYLPPIKPMRKNKVSSLFTKKKEKKLDATNGSITYKMKSSDKAIDSRQEHDLKSKTRKQAVLKGKDQDQPDLETHLSKILKKTSFERTKSDLNFIFNHMRPLKAFANVSDYLLQELCTVFRYKEIDKNRVLVFQGKALRI